MVWQTRTQFRMGIGSTFEDDVTPRTSFRRTGRERDIVHPPTSGSRGKKEVHCPRHRLGFKGNVGPHRRTTSNPALYTTQTAHGENPGWRFRRFCVGVRDTGRRRVSSTRVTGTPGTSTTLVLCTPRNRTFVLSFPLVSRPFAQTWVWCGTVYGPFWQ